MNNQFLQLWCPGGKADRRTYVLVGVLGFLIKHNLDRMVATLAFRRDWGVFNYWVPVREVLRVTQLHRNEAIFLGTMVALALPFIWLGVVMTLKRLRSAQLPQALIVFFFLPFINLLLFVVLSLLPERDFPAEWESQTATDSWLKKIVPENAWGSAAVSLAITVPLGLVMAVLGVDILKNYGWGVFVALPYTMGFAAALVYGLRQPRSLGASLTVACMAIGILGAVILGIAFEGAFCLLMAAPLALLLAMFGGICGYLVQKQRWFQDSAPAVLTVLLLLVPGVQSMEKASPKAPANFVVRSTINIDAPPEVVWKQVVAFTEIPPPREWIFRAGIAYPIRAEIVGSGVGAERHCVFSTGAFVEPIEVWDEPHRLKFSVSSNPPPMQEWTPYSQIDVPHLHGFLVSSGGQFLLMPLANGGTRLEGTTWYRHGLWPSAYWQLWSDAIIHQIHMRVLTHIKDNAEQMSP